MVVGQAENIVWPRFLNKLREAFSLDSIPGFEEQNIITSQVVSSQSSNTDGVV
jgi:hypothetical protein